MNHDEPTPPVVTVGTRPPSWIRQQRARRAWRDLTVLLTAQRVLTTLDTMALGLLVDAFADYQEASDVIAHVGAYYESTTEGGGIMVRRHPAVDDRKDAWVRLERLLGRFGMNPAERSRIRAATDAGEDPFEQLLRARASG